MQTANCDGIKATEKFLHCPICTARHVPAQGTLQDGVFAANCDQCGHFFKFRASSNVKSTITLTINGQKYTVGNEYDASTSLNVYLRKEGISRGTKYMCREGGCGSCIVTAMLYDPLDMEKKTYSINSCMCPLLVCDGWEIMTIEGLGNTRTGLHPIQERLASYNGSQCGFCSPGQVMSMYGFLEQNPKPTVTQVEDIFDGNICRCTGYRPILDAMKSFAINAPEHLKGGCIDIEDLKPGICSKTGRPCSDSCVTPRNESVHMILRDAQWFHPMDLVELMTLVEKYKSQKYRLVFGNTGYGPFNDVGMWNYDILIDLHGIKELFAINFDTQAMFGACVSLTCLLHVFSKTSQEPEFSYFLNFSSALGRVANKPVRNASGWAGNLMLKHRHPEFPSDLFVMFECVGAKLYIADSPTAEPKNYGLMDFLKLDMTGKVILYMTLPSLTSDYKVRSTKIMPRTENARAYVNAGFMVQVDKTKNYTVKSRPSLVFGGISKTFNHAVKTEDYLTGKQLAEPSVLKDALFILESEISPDADPVLASAAYRKSAAISLFYKFVLSVCIDKVGQRYRSGATGLSRPVSTGQQTYDTNKMEWPLTEPLMKLEARAQTTGEAEFVNDIPPRANELHGAFVSSTVGNATIASVDPSAALKMPGVVKYISVDDIPFGGVNNCMPPPSLPEEVFSSGKIEYAGQAIGMIVADDEQTAATAARMVKVTYTDVKPPILTIEEAIKQKSMFPKQADDLVIGDAEKAIKDSAKKISGTIAMGTQYHFQMETQITVCVPTEDGMDVYAATQFTDYCQQAAAMVMGVKSNTVNVQVRRLGGAYGSKITRNFPITAACALAAKLLNRPVRVNLDLSTNMEMIGKRYPYRADYEVGVTDDGLLNGVIVTYYADCGSNPNDNSLQGILVWADNAYHCENWHLIPVALKTNKPPNTACRSPGSLPAIFITESIMEHVAKALGKDPVALKELNFYKKGQTSLTGGPLPYFSLDTILPDLQKTAEIATRKTQIDAFNKANRWKKRALSVIPIKFGIAWTGANYNCFLSVYNGDGTVAICHGGIESGQGVNTKVAQVAAYELGIPIGMISIKPTNTLTTANSITTGGSITSELTCKAVIQCCAILKARLAPVKSKMTNPTWKELIKKCFNESIDLCVRFWSAPVSKYIFQYHSYGVTCTEVEIDVLTGENQINRVDLVYDCGESMNPGVDVGQVEGAFVMGLGYHLTEKTRYDPTSGQNLTNSTWEYYPPMSKDIPIDFRVHLLKNAPNPLGVLSAKACGEPPLCMSSSAFFALKHTVEAARAEINKDVYFRFDSPGTVEMLQQFCLLDKSQYVFQ